MKKKSNSAYHFNWDALAPAALTLLPAGHRAGHYLISMSAIVKTAATAGGMARSCEYSAPNYGPTQINGFGASGLTTPGNPPISFSSLSVISDGSAPVTLTFTPSGVTGAPVVDLYGNALLLDTY